MSTILKGKEFIIEHYGIKGMRWGVRRQPGPDGTVSSNPKAKAAAKGEESSSGKGSSGGGASKSSEKSDLSVDEMRQAVNRMQLEKQYAQLTTERAMANRTTGQKIADELKSIGMDVVKQQTRNTANALIKREIEKKLGIKTDNNKSKDSGKPKKSKKKSKNDRIKDFWEDSGATDEDD